MPGSRAATFLRSLRKVHAWVGLSGAAFGLLFGITGILQNHRDVMKIEAEEIREHKTLVDLPDVPASPQALAAQLAARFNLSPDRVQARVKPARAGRLAGVAVNQPEEWTCTVTGHAHFARATYVPGNRSLEVEQKDANLAGTLMRLHKADAGQGGWILLTDAFAGALVFLTLSGTLLWTRLSGPKLLAAGLSLGVLATAVTVALRSW